MYIDIDNDDGEEPRPAKKQKEQKEKRATAEGGAEPAQTSVTEWSEPTTPIPVPSSPQAKGSAAASTSKQPVMPQAGAGDEMKPSDVRAESETIEMERSLAAGGAGEKPEEEKHEEAIDIAKPADAKTRELKKPAKAGMRRARPKAAKPKSARSRHTTAKGKKASGGMARRAQAKRQARTTASGKRHGR